MAAGMAIEGLGRPACDGTKVGIAEGELSLGSAIARFRLDTLNAEHFVGSVTAGCLYFDAVAFFLTDQGAGNGGFYIEQSLFNTRLILANNLPGFFFIRVFIDQPHGGPKFNGTRQAGWIDHLGQRQRAFYLFNPTLDEAMFFTCRMIFGVFGQVAVFAGFRNGFYDCWAFG